MNDVEKQSGTKNATILMVFGGAFQLYLGYTYYQLSLLLSWDFRTLIVSVLIVIGLLTFCVGLIVWLQKAWATKLIAVVGIAACAAAAIFAYYGMIIILAPIYWFAISQLKQVNEHSDWHET